MHRLSADQILVRTGGAAGTQVGYAACCIVLLLMQAALRAGLDVHAANDVFLLPVAASLIPFVVWCFLCDIPVTVSYVYFVIKGQLKLPKAAAVCCPLGMSLLGKVIAAILLASGSKYSFLTACGESWGYAFMCLAFYTVVFAEKKQSVRGKETMSEGEI